MRVNARSAVCLNHVLVAARAECPTLTSKLTIPFVRGSQGMSAANGSLLDPSGIMLAGSSCKHYAVRPPPHRIRYCPLVAPPCPSPPIALQAYDVEERPVDRGHFSAEVSARCEETLLFHCLFLCCHLLKHGRFSSRDMFEYYLPPFHACIAVAKGMHVMTSLNAINVSTESHAAVWTGGEGTELLDVYLNVRIFVLYC